jgi:hypothetical protein
MRTPRPTEQEVPRSIDANATVANEINRAPYASPLSFDMALGPENNRLRNNGRGCCARCRNQMRTPLLFRYRGGVVKIPMNFHRNSS